MKITPGKRALSFRINDVSGIAGLIQPNSRVDIVLIADAGTEKGRVAKVFMENMRVLAIATQSQRSEDGRPIPAAVATVEVTPDEGEKLTLATTQGQIQLMLRGYGDPDSTKTAGASAAQMVRGLSNVPAGSAPAPRSEPRRAAARPSTPPPTQIAAPVVQAPAATPKPRPDTNTVTIIRGREASQQKFVDSTKLKSDSAARRNP